MALGRSEYEFVLHKTLMANLPPIPENASEAEITTLVADAKARLDAEICQSVAKHYVGDRERARMLAEADTRREAAAANALQGETKAAGKAWRKLYGREIASKLTFGAHYSARLR